MSPMSGGHIQQRPHLPQALVSQMSRKLLSKDTAETGITPALKAPRATASSMSWFHAVMSILLV